MFKNNLTLCRFILRRDWLRNVLWFTGILALVVGFGGAIATMYPDRESLNAMMETLESPAFKAMIGTAFMGEDGMLSLGGMYSVYMLVWSALIVGIMNVFLIVRHTRKDEERGRIEVVRSLPTGRLANLSSALTAAVVLNVLITLLAGFGLAMVGDRNMSDLGGGLLFGATMGTFGLVAAGITAIFCQLNKNPGTAMALSFGSLAVLYMLFAMGSIQESRALVNISLLGLLQYAKPYAGNDWLPIVITLIVAAVFMAAAFLLCRTRDMGESFIPERPGKKDASPYLKSPGGLAWRLLRTPFIVWLLVVPLLGIAYGSIMGDLESIINSNDMFYQISGGDPMRMASFFLLIMAVCAGIPVMQFILKARGQEKRGLAENVLARSASRQSQLRGYFIIALITAVVMPIMNAVGFWSGSTPVMEDPTPFANWFLGCAVYIPALLVLMGVAMVLTAYLPKFTGIAWGYLGFSFIVLYLGRMMDFPEWIGKLSPFGHVPMLPHVPEIGQVPVEVDGVTQMMPIFGKATYEISGGEITALAVMTALSIVMFVFGFIGYRKRDMKFSQ